MTAFKKQGNIQGTLMAKEDRTVVRLPNGDTQIDPHGRKARNDNWYDEVQENGVINYHYFSSTISKGASELLVDFFFDLRDGKNMPKGSGKKPRSANSIFGYRTRLPSIIEKLEKHSGKELLQVNEDDVLNLFKGMREGILLSKKGRPYKDTQTYAKYFCSFWRWHMRICRKKKIPVEDLVANVDLSRDSKPEWVYFTYEDVKRMVDFAPSLYYKALVLFLFDSGIRAPKELMNVRVKDLSPIPESTNYFLQIRHDTAKTFGRKIKLMLSSEMIRKFIEFEGKESEDYLFDKKYAAMNHIIKKIGFHVLKAGSRRKNKHNQHKFIGGISMYDFRHCSVCHYLPIYKSENQMKYRYGWKSSDMIHYYSEYIGMKDTLHEDDMISSNQRLNMQMDLEKEKQKVSILQEQLMAQQQEMQEKMKRMEAMMLQKFAENY